MVMTPRHGDAISGQTCRLYSIWRGMRQRCTNPNATSFDNYGGRGITVCSEWANYEDFRSWAMSAGYANNLSIERRNVNSGYYPDNCYWADNTIQACNKRKRTGKTSQYIGVAPNKFGWQAYVSFKGIRNHLGTFPSEIEAAKARDAFVIAQGLPHKLNF